MPTNFQNASNQLRNQVTEQFKGPDVVLPPQAVGPNIAAPDVHIPPPFQPPVVAPPVATPIDPGAIVPVDRQARRAARRAAGSARRAANWAEEGLNPLNVVPVNRGDMRGVLDQLRNTRRGDRVREVLGTKRGRQAAAAVGGAVMGRAARAQARQEKLAEIAAMRAAGQSMFENRPRGEMAVAPVAPVQAYGPAGLPLSPSGAPQLGGAVAAAGPAPGAIAEEIAQAPQMTDQERLQQLISQRNLPEAMGTRITTATQNMDPTVLSGLLSRYGR